MRGDPHYGQTRQAWRRIWDEADVDREIATRDYPRSRDIRDRYTPYLPAGEPILEAGCGLGVELLTLAERGLPVIGVDYAEGALRRLSRHGPRLRVAAADVHALPFGDARFGAYLSFGVLEHFADGPARALAEAHRVLRAGGVLVATVPAPNLVWRLARARTRRRGEPSPAPDGYFDTAYTAADLGARIESAGFRILESRPVGHSFTLWGIGWPFRAPGYYMTSPLAERAGAVLSVVLPRAMSFATLVIARKAGSA